jgi:hypothetical protein
VETENVVIIERLRTWLAALDRVIEACEQLEEAQESAFPEEAPAKTGPACRRRGKLIAWPGSPNQAATEIPAQLIRIPPRSAAGRKREESLALRH